MDQRELVRQMEAFFRKEDEEALQKRNEVQVQRDSLSDEEWWDQLVEQTRSIRPQMLTIFERNKAEIIAKRLETTKSEVGYYEKQIKQKVMMLLPHIMVIRSDRGITGDVSREQIEAARRRAEVDIPNKN